MYKHKNEIMAHQIGALRILRPTLSVSSFKFLLSYNSSHNFYGLTHASNFFSTVWFVLSSIVDS